MRLLPVALLALFAWTGTTALAQAPAGAAGHVAVPLAAAKTRVQLERAPLSATVITPGRSPRAAELAGLATELRPTEVLLTKASQVPIPRPQTEVHRAGARAWTMPYEARFQAADGVVRTARLVAEITGGGLRPMPAAAEFNGEVFVALEDRDDPTRTYTLPAAIEVLITAPLDRVDPGLVKLAATNAWRSVRLSAAMPPDEFRVRFRSPIDPQGYEVSMSTIRPKLRVDVSPRYIQGLGLELATVSVSAEGLPNPLGRRVSLSADRGSLSASELPLDAQGMAQTQLRSIAIGRATVTARSPALQEGRNDEIAFRAPWPFALAAAVGGATGAAIRRYQGGRGRTVRRRAPLTDVAVGTLVGLVVAVLYAVGVNLLPITPTATAGEALVFGLAALGGFAGLRLPVKIG